MGVWNKVRPLVAHPAKGGGLRVDDYPEYTAFSDEFLAGVDAAQAAAKDGEVPDYGHLDHWLVVRGADGPVTYRLLLRDGLRRETLAQLHMRGWEPDSE